MSIPTFYRLYQLHRRAPMARRAAFRLVMERVTRDRYFSVKNIKKSKDKL